MAGRVLVWVGGVVAVAAAAGLGVYFTRVGLEDADKLASVIGVFVGLAGLGVAVFGLVADRRADRDQDRTGDHGGTGDGESDRPQQPQASGERPVAIGGDNPGIVSTGDGATSLQQQATASGDARVYQAGRDQTINDK